MRRNAGQSRSFIELSSHASCRGRGFTLVELLVTITIIALAAALVAPVFNDDARLRLVAAAEVLTSDIEYAQVMTIAQPDDPVIVRFDQENNAYWLAFASDSETPIERGGSMESYYVRLGEGRAVAANGVSYTLTDLDGATLMFNAQGGLVDFTINPEIQLSCSTQTITLAIAPTTGTVSHKDTGAQQVEANE